MTVAITGASGFIGGSALAHLRARGVACLTLGRRPVEGLDVAHRFLELGPDPAPGTFDGVDCLVHCAWDLSVRSVGEVYRRNVVGSTNLLRAARTAGVGRIVFVSSMSAYLGTRQLYGRSKLDVEQLVSELGGLSLRLGLVWGTEAGGMAGAVQRLAALPVVPVLGRNSYQFTVHRDDVDLAIQIAVEDVGLGGVVGVAHPAAVRLPELLTGFARMAGADRTGHLLAIPWQPVYWTMRVAEAARAPLPLRGDSVLGLVRPAPRVPNIEAWSASGLHFRPFAS